VIIQTNWDEGRYNILNLGSGSTSNASLVLGVINGENLGGNYGIFSHKVLTTLYFKSLRGGSNISLSSNSTGITISSTGLTTAANFNTYSGTTVPNTYLSKSAFNTYSGSTATAITNKLLITSFNTYSGTTVPNTYLAKSTFATYSGATAPATYLSKSAFNTYSGSTATAINNKLAITTYATYTGNTLSSITSKLPTTTFSTYTGNTLTSINGKLSTTSFNTYSGTTVPNTYLSKSAFNTYSGNTIYRVNLPYSTGITLNISSLEQKRFVITGNTTGNATVTISNSANAEVFTLDILSATTTVALTLPSTVRMQNYEVTNSRWVSATRVLTLPSGRYQLTFGYNGTVYLLNCSDKYV
jgi:nitrogen fixation protein FixH